MPERKHLFLRLSLLAAACLSILVCGAAFAAGDSKLAPMDAAAATEVSPQAPAPDAASPGGGAWSTGESGSWSLDAQESREKKERGAAATGSEPAADDPAFHSGYWSSTSGKAAPSPGGNPGVNPGASPDAAPPSQAVAPSGDAGLYEGHNTVVTSIQTCYSQLDAATVAEIQRSYVKPYEECQKRLAEKIQKRNYAKAGQLQDALTPETPRNYVRVQNNFTAP